MPSKMQSHNQLQKGTVAMSLNRIKELQGRMAGAGIDAAIIIYSRDLLYYAGTVQPCVLVVTPKEFHLFIRRGYDFAITETWLDKGKLSNESRLEAVSNKLKEWKVTEGSVGLELDAISAETYLRWRELLPNFEIVNVSPLILEQRKKKDSDEIALIRKACHIMDAGHRRALEVLKEGITELELSAAVEDAHRRAGHEGLLFFRRPDFFMSRGPIGSGANLLKVSGIVYTITGVGLSAAVPAGPSLKKIQRGEPVIVDLPTVYRGYHCDQTRTYVVGKAGAGIRSLYYGLKDISDYLIANMSQGRKCKEIFQLAWERAKELKSERCFMSFGERQNTSFIGHGIGLECNELPMLSPNDDSVLEAGCTLALDMHMLHPEQGAVKLEDTILITDTGAEILTVSPRELFEIER